MDRTTKNTTKITRTIEFVYWTHHPQRQFLNLANETSPARNILEILFTDIRTIDIIVFNFICWYGFLPTMLSARQKKNIYVVGTPYFLEVLRGYQVMMKDYAEENESLILKTPRMKGGLVLTGVTLKCLVTLDVQLPVLPPVTDLIACEAAILGPSFIWLDLLALALAFAFLGCILDGLNWSLPFAGASMLVAECCPCHYVAAISPQ
ncbi:hypothetical protein OSB04_021142 [Centaurea solstitialis]|uniref:Uncharacterized protein n=1 Tax=Centaurea solstitialis TaxID=347529 RepID=A0AA38WFY7_9ASTR|nr:hypothetical protein OSB04_021142 [Centaurea solstitialis]